MSSSEPATNLESTEAALQRATSAFATHIDDLAECHRSLAQLMRKRVTGPWTSYEHAAYLRLRRASADSYRRLLRTQRNFDRIRRHDLQVRDVWPDKGAERLRANGLTLRRGAA